MTAAYNIFGSYKPLNKQYKIKTNGHSTETNSIK